MYPIYKMFLSFGTLELCPMPGYWDNPLISTFLVYCFILELISWDKFPSMYEYFNISSPPPNSFFKKAVPILLLLI